MHQDNAAAARGPRNPWQYFPWFIALGMGAVIAVNCVLAYAALHTFPGNAGSDGFDLSNHYNAVLERVRQEAALGWSVHANLDRAGHPVIILADRSATPLGGAEVEATALRPLGDSHRHNVRFSEASPGMYRGDAALDEKGQWDLEIRINAGGHEFSATRRILLR